MLLAFCLSRVAYTQENEREDRELGEDCEGVFSLVVGVGVVGGVSDVSVRLCKLLARLLVVRGTRTKGSLRDRLVLTVWSISKKKWNLGMILGNTDSHERE